MRLNAFLTSLVCLGMAGPLLKNSAPLEKFLATGLFDRVLYKKFSNHCRTVLFRENTSALLFINPTGGFYPSLAYDGYMVYF